MEFEVRKSWLDNVPEIEDGTYQAVFEGIEKRTIRARGQDTEVLVWKFDIDGTKVEGITSATLTRRSKAYAWFKAMVGKDFDKVDDEKLKGTKVLVTIGHRVIRRGDNEIRVPRIENVSPMPKTKAKS